MTIRLLEFIIFFTATSIGATALGQTAMVDVTLTPAGSFQIKSRDVRGSATRTASGVEAKDILVGLRNIQTGISLRDTHTKKRLQVDKFPDAILVKAKGSNGKGIALIRIMGIQKKISGTYTINGKTLQAKFPLKISDFKIEDVKYMGVGVDDDVSVSISVPIQ